jgi:hypothetical protein
VLDPNSVASFEQAPPRRPAAFHHLWVGDDRHGANWRGPAEDHFNRLAEAQFAGDVHVGLVGGPEQREEAAHWLNGYCPFWELLVVAEEGFEMVTLNVLHQWSKRADVPPETPVLYTHGKGSFNDHPGNHAWRGAVEEKLIGGWRECASSLSTADVVTCHWLSRERYPDLIHQPGIAGGNFWWATAGYIAGLPPVEWASRWCAEGWIGLNSPRVENLIDGWPRY